MSSLTYRVIFQIELLKVMLGPQGYLVAFPGWVYERVGGIIQRQTETHHILLIPIGPLTSPYHSRFFMAFMDIPVSSRNPLVSSNNFQKKTDNHQFLSTVLKHPRVPLWRIGSERGVGHNVQDFRLPVLTGQYL